MHQSVSKEFPEKFYCKIIAQWAICSLLGANLHLLSSVPVKAVDDDDDDGNDAKGWLNQYHYSALIGSYSCDKEVSNLVSHFWKGKSRRREIVGLQNFSLYKMNGFEGRIEIFFSSVLKGRTLTLWDCSLICGYSPFSIEYWGKPPCDTLSKRKGKSRCCPCCVDSMVEKNAWPKSASRLNLSIAAESASKPPSFPTHFHAFLCCNWFQFISKKEREGLIERECGKAQWSVRESFFLPISIHEITSTP